MITSNIKKEIINDWSDKFEYLSIYAQNKLYRICGAFLLGIEIVNLPRSEEYRPIFIVYALWKEDIKHCLEEPVFMQEIYNMRGFQFNIPYIKHAVFFEEAVECTMNQAKILGNGKITLTQLFEVFNKQFSQTLIKSSPVGQAKLFEAKLLGALYVNDMNLAKRTLDEINKAS